MGLPHHHKKNTSSAMDKIQEIYKNHKLAILELSKKGTDLLINGNFRSFEQGLVDVLNDLHNKICVQMINETMNNPLFEEKIKEIGSSEGVTSLSKRKVSVQFKTGNKCVVESFYGKRKKSKEKIDRHIGLTYLGFVKKASPSYLSISSLVSVLCPSYDIGQQLMVEMGINGQYNRIRDLSLTLGNLAFNQGIRSVISSEESMKGKRVVVMIDGGRSRTRLNKEELTSKGNPKFLTEWKEVKVVVIQVLNENGKVDKKVNLPIYDITVGHIEKSMAKLTEALLLLNVSAAKEVQFISDGATCFWNRIATAFDLAKVPQNKITYTLDYYHAVEHLSALLSSITDLKEMERKKYFVAFKQDLWTGQIGQLIKNVKFLCKEKAVVIKDKLKTEIAYFEKHQNRMNYKLFRHQKWLCGSGAVESAIRRIINLRFKAPSSFWLEQHLEPLAFLRAAFLSGRWNILLHNIKY